MRVCGCRVQQEQELRVFGRLRSTGALVLLWMREVDARSEAEGRLEVGSGGGQQWKASIEVRAGYPGRDREAEQVAGFRRHTRYKAILQLDLRDLGGIRAMTSTGPHWSLYNAKAQAIILDISSSTRDKTLPPEPTAKCNEHSENAPQKSIQENPLHANYHRQKSGDEKKREYALQNTELQYKSLGKKPYYGDLRNGQPLYQCENQNLAAFSIPTKPKGRTEKKAMAVRGKREQISNLRSPEKRKGVASLLALLTQSIRGLREPHFSLKEDPSWKESRERLKTALTPLLLLDHRRSPAEPPPDHHLKARRSVEPPPKGPTFCRTTT
ncbi:hypothetical protein M5K25_006892 [Dendrobium thyrsiflorum]|uniref:Uncharacterized protein n=1 Tax=Dendrobium thyrsiflorum TaxID=117978 RepID=A0ABD0VCB3_DENTH